jgi:hypothetical protein
MSPLSAAKTRIKPFLKSRFPAVDAVQEFVRRYRAHYFPVYLDYPIKPLPRYGWGAMPHPLLYSLIEKNRDDYAALIGAFTSYKNGLKLIPQEKPNSASCPYWANGWIEGIEAVSLYALPHLFKSKLYIEIGSGNSTKFVRQSITDNHLDTKIISIDPHPRVEVDTLCDKVIRSPLEDINISLFNEMQSGDILMIDGSHRCFQNSDVTTVFVDILPTLNPGVLIYIDDIYLPWDYPTAWSNRYYSEQYVLAVMLLADAGRRYEILLPAWFITTDEELRKVVEMAWKESGIENRNYMGGNGFWIRVIAKNEVVARVPKLKAEAVAVKLLDPAP